MNIFPQHLQIRSRLNFDQFNFKHQSRFGRDFRWTSVIAIAQMGRNEQFPFFTDTHAAKQDNPTLITKHLPMKLNNLTPEFPNPIP